MMERMKQQEVQVKESRWMEETPSTCIPQLWCFSGSHIFILKFPLFHWLPLSGCSTFLFAVLILSLMFSPFAPIS